VIRTLGRVADRIGALAFSAPRIVRIILGGLCMAFIGIATERVLFGHYYSQWTSTVAITVTVLPVLWAANKSWVPRGTRPLGLRVLAVQLAVLAIPVVAALRVGPTVLLTLSASAVVAGALWRYVPLPLARGHRIPRKARTTA
jgi:hypothetical protein